MADEEASRHAANWGGAPALVPVYVRQDENGLVYGQSVDELVWGAPQPLTPDWRAWACQFYLGYPLGRRTHFRQISMLRPGETCLPADDSWSAESTGGDARLLAAVPPSLLQQPDDDDRDATDPIFFARFAQEAPAGVLSGPVARTFERLARDELRRELERLPRQRRTFWFLLNNLGWRAVAQGESSPIAKHSDITFESLLEDIRCNATHPADSGGVIDWFSVDPASKINKDTNEPMQTRRLRALQNLNLYSLWLTRYRDRMRLDHVLDYALLESRTCPPLKSAMTASNTDYTTIARRYLELAKSTSDSRLRFHLTMDVEAFPTTDIYAYHTAESELLERLVYGNLGSGSEIEQLLLQQRVPCTYFLEAYSPAWTDETLADAARFFKKDFTELGLHCHAFSLTREFQEELGLKPGWFLEPAAFSTVLRHGKQRLEAASGERLMSYRSGRLDVYPDMEQALADAGFLIDSSLANGRDAYYYTQRSSEVGNGIQRWGSLIEVPVTTYRARDRTLLLDFNGSSFEEICFVVTRALELGLPTVTLLMHSWSLSDIREEPLLAKGFHYAKSSALREKLVRILDFLHQLPSVDLSTLRETVARFSPEAAMPSFPTALLELDSSPFGVLAWQDGDGVIGRCVLSESPFSGSPEFAFYFMIRGERVATRWYEPTAEARFALPEGTSASDVEIRGFVREQKSPGQPMMKVARLA